MQHIREIRRTKGLCTQCGYRQARENMAWCSHCCEINNKSKKKKIAYLNANNLCLGCMEKPQHEAKLCEECYDVYLEDRKQKRQFKIENGICPGCSKINTSDKKHCLECRKKERERCKRYRAQTAKIPRYLKAYYDNGTYADANEIIQMKQDFISFVPRLKRMLTDEIIKDRAVLIKTLVTLQMLLEGHNKQQIGEHLRLTKQRIHQLENIIIEGIHKCKLTHV